jgi:hypothetical protein
MTALLALVVFVPEGVFTKSREYARRTSCANNLHQIGTALSSYAGDLGEAFPPDLGKLYPGYIGKAETFSCPSARSRWQQIAGLGEVDQITTTSYVYVAGLKDGDISTCVLAYDRPGNHKDGGNVMFIGSRVQWMSAAELQQAIAETRALAKKQGREIKLVGE